MKRNTVIIAVLFIATVVAIRFGFSNSSTETGQNTYNYNTETSATDQQNMQEDVLGEQKYTAIPDPVLEADKNYSVTLKTNKGDITLQLFHKEVPVAANNFAALIKDGFYNGLSFHRVIDGFMVQGGDPNGDGTGGPGYAFDDEPVTREYKRGTIAYANSGPNTNGSQFFIMHQDYPLPKKYIIFGEVISGIEVVDTLATTTTRMSDYGEPSIPTEDLKIETATLQEF